METWGSCCITRYAINAEMDRITLRYRPIAPKPAAGPAASLEALQACDRRPRRGKRKRRGENPSRRKIRKMNAVAFKEEEREDHLTSSFPPPPSSSCSSFCFCSSCTAAIPLKEEEKAPAAPSPGNTDPEAANTWTLVAPRPVRPAGSWVTVEHVTGTWGAGGFDEASDEDVRRALAVETDPAFVSDALDQVTWTNEAYRRMVVGPEEEEVEIRVALVTRGMVPAGGTFRGFTCGVRVRHAWKGKPRASMASPCDVWRLRDGSLAWRLDVKAALSLGSGT